MPCHCITRISQIPGDDWNALINDASPFVRHEFLHALETSGCVSADKGWLPHHIVCFDQDTLVAATPFYIKGHSYGEYIFDWAWADAYYHHGHEYYPKGLCAIPFTPASASKILIKQGYDAAHARRQIITHAMRLADELNLSSIHALFLTDEELKAWIEQGFTARNSYQFHWKNNNYATFEDYLHDFTAAKRKKIRQQRKSLDHSGIQFKVLQGNCISERHWQNLYRFYQHTVHLHGATAYLNLNFFLRIGQTMPHQIVLIAVYLKDENVASALFLKSDTTLFGRYWGSDIHISNLHFEVCYYQAIEYCIKNKISFFEAGAQGQHKLSRGLLPVNTLSAHWLRHSQFYQAVKDHIAAETEHIDHHLGALRLRTPFKEQ